MVSPYNADNNALYANGQFSLFTNDLPLSRLEDPQQDKLKNIGRLIKADLHGNFLEAEKLLKEIIESESLSSSKFFINIAKLNLSKLYWDKSGCNYSLPAIILCRNVIEDVSSEEKQVTQAKYLLGSILKKGDVTNLQEAWSIFGEIMNKDFPNQDWAKLLHAGAFLKLNTGKEPNEINHTDFKISLKAISALIANFKIKESLTLKKLGNEMFGSTCAIAVRLFDLKYRDIYKNITVFRKYLIFVFTAYVLGSPETRRFAIDKLITFDPSLKNKLISAYLSTHVILTNRDIKVSIEWLSSFGKQEDFLEEFAGIFGKSKEDNFQAEEMAKLKEMQKIIKYYVKNGLDFTQYYNSENVRQKLDLFFFEETFSIPLET